MNIESAFNDLGVNAIKATEMLESLGISVHELNIPSVFIKLQSVVDYLKNFPEDTQRFLINKATRGKTIDKLSHMFEYTMILKEKEFNEKELEKTSKEISAVGFNDVPKMNELSEKKNQINTKLTSLHEELEVFNK